MVQYTETKVTGYNYMQQLERLHRYSGEQKKSNIRVQSTVPLKVQKWVKQFYGDSLEWWLYSGEWVLTRMEKAQEASGALENVLYLALGAGYISLNIYKKPLKCLLKFCVCFFSIEKNIILKKAFPHLQKNCRILKEMLTFPFGESPGSMF